jgi:hypothetical protein
MPLKFPLDKLGLEAKIKINLMTTQKLAQYVLCVFFVGVTPVASS